MASVYLSRVPVEMKRRRTDLASERKIRKFQKE